MLERKLPSIADITSLRGTYVLVRASFNVPLKDDVVANQFRIKRALPTIEHLVARGARVVLLAHIGRDTHATLRPVYDVLSQYISLAWCNETVGPRATELRNKMEDGDVLLLENVRSHEGEVLNDATFAKSLSKLGDVYVNDAFSDSHRAHASIVGIPQYLPSYFGLQFEEEYYALKGARTPEHPSLFILGGAKFDTKLPLVEAYLNTYNHVFVGGALAHDIWRAYGYELGTSLVSSIDLREHPLIHAKNLVLPVDVTVTKGDCVRVTTPEKVEKDEMIVDAGPKTIANLMQYIDPAKTILWNGPLGNYEHGFQTGTEQLAEQIAHASAHSIVGGGDTIASIETRCLKEQFSFLSTAGGAMLTFLETGTLPALDAFQTN